MRVPRPEARDRDAAEPGVWRPSEASGARPSSPQKTQVKERGHAQGFSPLNVLLAFPYNVRAVKINTLNMQLVKLSQVWTDHRGSWSLGRGGRWVRGKGGGGGGREEGEGLRGCRWEEPPPPRGLPDLGQKDLRA